MAFVRDIKPNTYDSHQSSPGYVLTFLRWSNRDTFNYENFEDNLDVRKPLVVYNDALSVVVSNSKKALNPTVQIQLKGGDLNYATAVHPGDYLLVNMLNWEDDAERVRIKAGNLQPINQVGDGFKGVYKVQTVNKRIRVDRSTGKKSVIYNIQASGFTEFNNVLYYNTALARAFQDTATGLYQTLIGDYFTNLIKTRLNIQEIIPILFKILIGKSRRDRDPKIQKYGNTHFRIPSTLGRLINKNDAQFASDIFNYVIGAWGDSREANVNDSNIGPHMNPNFRQDFNAPNFYSTGKPIQGNKQVQLENWNQVKAWSVLKGYLNPTLNEMYSTYRVAPDNTIQPTVVVRQKPFTNEHFEAPSSVSDSFVTTKYLRLPRWRISSNLLYDVNLSTSEQLRFNFIQVFSRTLPDTQEMDYAQQTELGNFVVDEADIERNGLKPYIVHANFDFPELKNKRLRAAEWAHLVSDWIIDGHLKETGSLTFYGIQDPVAVGDNIEFDNVVYHVEAVTDSMVIQGDKKFWTTKVQVSYGMDKRSSKQGPVYPNMEHTDAHTDNIEDYNNERILPGISDTQDILGRVDGEEHTIGTGEDRKTGETAQISFTPPSLRRSRQRTGEDNRGTNKRIQQLSKGRSNIKKGDE